MTDEAKRPRIARIWRGRTKREQADEYEAYNYEAGIKPLIEKALGVQTLREDRADETEFLTISFWESVEAMSRFTGGDPTRIHHLDRDPEFLIELPERVQVLEIRASSPVASAAEERRLASGVARAHGSTRQERRRQWRGSRRHSQSH